METKVLQAFFNMIGSGSCFLCGEETDQIIYYGPKSWKIPEEREKIGDVYHHICHTCKNDPFHQQLCVEKILKLHDINV